MNWLINDVCQSIRSSKLQLDKGLLIIRNLRFKVFTYLVLTHCNLQKKGSKLTIYLFIAGMQ